MAPCNPAVDGAGRAVLQGFVEQHLGGDVVVDQAEFVLQSGKRLQVGLEAPEREQGREEVDGLAQLLERDAHAVAFFGFEFRVALGEAAGLFGAGLEALPREGFEVER